LNRAGDVLALLGRRVVLDDARTVGFRCLPLHFDALLGITIVAGMPRACTRAPRLRVVPGRVSEHAARPVHFGNARDRVVGASDLEGAYVLERLALEEDLGEDGVRRAGTTS
jgi:hypothetical protein